MVYSHIVNWHNIAGLGLIWISLSGIILASLILHLRFKTCALLAGPSFANFKNYQRKLIFKMGLWILIFISLWIAYLAPQWGHESQPVIQAGRNVIIALDVSRSMLAQDLKPNRLTFAKDKIRKLITQLAGEQVGLILFAGDAIVACPLTRDQDLLLTFLTEVDGESASLGSTNLAQAITTAQRMFAQAGLNGTNLLAIFTDGEDFSQGLESAGSAAAQAGIAIFTFGVGTTQGAPIPASDTPGQPSGFIKNKAQEIVISRLDQDLLQTISAKCRGQSMVVSVTDDHDLTQLGSWINQFERNQLSTKTFTQQQDRYYYFVTLALICLILEWLL